MNRFTLLQRIRVTPETGHQELVGMTGTVTRLLKRDESAWINMDEDLPPKLVSFPDKDDPRHRHVNLFPDECEVIEP